MSRWLAERATSLLDRRSSRRSFLARTAVVGSAVAAAPAAFLLKPNSAYAAVCGPDSECSDGYTAFCCTINRGLNKCPPGTFVAGWWKADSSVYCCEGGRPRPRYYIDCQGECTRCADGCANGRAFCNSSCVTCAGGCNTGDNTTCDHRRVCANYFRYGQCHTEIACSGPVACRVVTCTPPYELYDSCGSRPLTDNRTASHTAPCLSPACA